MMSDAKQTIPIAAKGRYRGIALGILVIVLALDQLSKNWIIQTLTPEVRFISVAPFFDLVMVWNYGISFGMLAGQRQPLLLTLLSLVIVLVLAVWLYRNDSKLVAVALGLVMGGAIGNVIDRVRFGAVADFLDFHIGPYHWPAFNVADSSIFMGVVLLCMSSMVTPIRHDEKDRT